MMPLYKIVNGMKMPMGGNPIYSVKYPKQIRIRIAPKAIKGIRRIPRKILNHNGRGR